MFIVDDPEMPLFVLLEEAIRLLYLLLEDRMLFQLFYPNIDINHT